jgi:hypothetical protein
VRFVNTKKANLLCWLASVYRNEQSDNRMGVVNQNDVLTTIGAIESGLAACGYKFQPGVGLAAAQNVFMKS